MKKLSDTDYAALANFRHALRCFLEFSENAAAEEGLTPRQPQALLVVRRSIAAPANIGRLAERLHLDEADKRSVILALTGVSAPEIGAPSPHPPPGTIPAKDLTAFTCVPSYSTAADIRWKESAPHRSAGRMSTAAAACHQSDHTDKSKH